MKTLASVAMSHLTPSAAPPTTATAPCAPERLSSPPPAIEDELIICMRSFGASRIISATTIADATAKLEEVAFTPDIMGEVTASRLQELTGFAEGHAIALRKFSRDWCGKVDAKRARRA
jgi:hypothetical protein